MTEIVLTRQAGIAVEETATFWRRTDQGKKERLSLPIADCGGVFRAYGDAVLIDLATMTAHRIDLAGRKEALSPTACAALFAACKTALHDYSKRVRRFDDEFREIGHDRL